MTVAELIAKLKKMPQDMLVYTDKYDEAIEEPVTIVKVAEVFEMDKVEYIPNRGWTGPARRFNAVKVL